jgi:Tfp pilus assembly protein PilZ
VEISKSQLASNEILELAMNTVKRRSIQQNRVMKSIAEQYAQTNFAEQNVNAGSVKNNQDPRRYPRKPFFKSVFFNYRDQKYKGVIKNASRGGVFIETRAQFLFGQSIELVIHSNKIENSKRVQAWMVHSSRRGIGVTFKRIFERRSGKERRNAIDRRSGLDRRTIPKAKDRHRKMDLLNPGINIKP